MDVCTTNELVLLAHRFEVAKLICEGAKYREIIELTKASSMVISRVKRIVDEDGSVLAKVAMRN